MTPPSQPQSTVHHLRDLRRLLGSRPLFSVGACVCLLDPENRLLLQRRADNGRWGLIGGSSELGESAVMTAVRETHEEIGLALPEQAFELLHVMSGPELYFRYPNGDEVYNVGSVFLARLPDSTTTLCPDHESMELRFFSLGALPSDLSGPVELEALRVLRAHLGLSASSGPQVTQPVPPVGQGYLLELRKIVGTMPLFSVGAAVVALDEQGRVLLHRRADTGRWGLPGGSSELGETFAQTARRELREETGVDAQEVRFVKLLMGPDYHFRYPNGDEVYLVSALCLAQVRSDTALLPLEGGDSQGETLEVRFFSVPEALELLADRGPGRDVRALLKHSLSLWSVHP